MTNPFVFGRVVEGEEFYDRKNEMAELERRLNKCENVLLLSPRKYGKRSLVINVLSRMREKGALGIYINLNKVTSLQRLLGFFIRAAVLEIEKDKEKAVALFKGMLPEWHKDIEIDIDDLIDPGIKSTKGIDIISAAQEIFSFPQRFALGRGKVFVVAFADFQELDALNGEDSREFFKSCVQKNKNVSYLFSGLNIDESRDLDQLCEDYQIDHVMELKKMPRAGFSKFLQDKFKQTGYELEEGIVNKVLDKVNDFPYNAQFLCHELWELKHDEKEIRKKDVDTALGEILKKQYPVYVSTWDSLTVCQKNVLRAVAKLGGEQIFSQEFARQGGVGSISSLQTSVQLLMKKNILNRIGRRYEFTDVFFRDWIRLEIN